MTNLIKNDHLNAKFLRLTDLVVDLIELGKSKEEITEFLRERMIENMDIRLAYQSAKTLIELREMPMPPSHEER